MDATRNLKVIITADTAEAKAAMASLSTTTGTLGKDMENLGGSMSKMGKTLTTYATLPIVGLGAAVAKMASDFQQQMTYVRTDAGDTTDDIKKLSDQVLQLAKTSQFGPDELAKGLYHLASLGLRGADAMNALNTAQQMASVGGANLEDTTSALGAALVTGIKGVQDYSSAAGTLDAIIGAGNMRMQDLVNALGSGILPVAKNAGLSLTDVGAALATLTDNGMAADESATRLRMTFALMEAPSKKAAGQLAAIGMTADQMAMDMRTKGLIPALQDLKQHLLDTYGTTAEGQTKMATALTEIFGGGRSSAAAQTLIEQLDRVSNKYAQISSQTGEFSQKVAEQQETASARIKTAWSSMQADAIQLGGSILPAVATAFGKFADVVTHLTDDWNKLTGTQQQFIIKTAEVVAVLGPGLNMFGKLTSTFGTLIKLSTGLYGVLGRVAGGVAMGGEEATAALGSSGLLGALGPLGVGLGIVTLGVGAAYLWLHKFHQEAKDGIGDLQQYNSTTGETAGSVSMLNLWTNAQTNAQNDLKKSTDDLASAQQQIQPIQDNVKQKSQELSDAQNAVNDAFKKFGANSPQYAAATETLTQKQDAYNAAFQTELDNGVTIQTLEGQIKKAKDDLAAANQNLAYWEDVANGKIATGISLAGTFSDVIKLNLIPQVNALQGSLSRVQTGNVGGYTQIPSGRQLQGGGMNLQGGRFASGTSYAPGGWSLVGESGPELVNLPRGSQVVSSDESASMLGGGQIHITVQAGTIVGNGQELAQMIWQELQRLARANGFNGVLPNIGVMPTG